MKMAKFTEKARPMIEMARSLIVPLGTPLISSGSCTEKRINSRCGVDRCVDKQRVLSV